jgi:multimeric flavodoxin WrbA
LDAGWKKVSATKPLYIQDEQMGKQVLGISGSPVKNSNTDRAVKAVMEASGLAYEFVKLSEHNIRPCQACKQCVNDNVCKQEDDFEWLSKKLLEADALVIGAYSPYSNLDAFTKAFVERLWSLRHVNNQLKNKPVVIIVSGVYPKMLDNPVLKYTGISKLARRIALPVDKVTKNLAKELRMDNMHIIGQVKLKGNVPCLTCGNGDTCQMSNVKFLHGKDAEASADKCVKVEDQPDTWKQLQQLGKKLANETAQN